jgi:hypothetical protein
MASPVPLAPTLEVQRLQDLLTRMLRRLPASLWDTSPTSATLQRDLYRAFASVMVEWLAQRDIARTMTLLLEAQAGDLDVLLQDYGLRRYLQRPDAYARQIGMNLLWTPKGTLYSVAQVADLLLESPHVTLRTGPSHVHVFLAQAQSITTPYSYWGLLAQDGTWYAVTIDAAVPMVSRRPPPGMNVAPGPHTLSWFTALDQFGATWYLTIASDTLVPVRTQPSGYGTTEPFRVLDGLGQRWGLSVDGLAEATIPVLDTGLAGFGYWRLLDSNGATQALWIEARVPTTSATPPGGASDQTPGGTPLRWFRAYDGMGTAWYVFLEDDSLAATLSSPGGTGSAAPLVLLDAGLQRWTLTVDAATTETVVQAAENADLVVVAPDAPHTAVQLLDANLTPWWLSIDARVTQLTPLIPVTAINATPPGGAFRWLRVYDRAGGLWYLFPSPTGVLVVDTVSPGGAGTGEPQTLGDTGGTRWRLGVDVAGSLGLSEALAVDYGGFATAVCLTDPQGGRWFWRVDGSVLEWSETLWPDTIDQSPWGSLGWLQVMDEVGSVRYAWPDAQGGPLATTGPPPGSPWGWRRPIVLRDRGGTQWTLHVLVDACLGVLQVPPDDFPDAPAPLVLPEALEALHHVQAAGSLVTLYVQ